MTIEQIDTGIKGKFEAREDSKLAGKMFYTWAGTDKIIIDHTEVNPEFSGHGVGKAMLMALVEFARNKKIKVLPLCPYAKSVFDKTPEISDVLF